MHVRFGGRASESDGRNVARRWCSTLPYIPMKRGFVYLIAVIDWFSRRVLSWKLSITMDVSFCLEALDEAIRMYGRPEIFNTDQGSQFTSEAFTGRLRKKASRSAWTGRGAGVTTCSLNASGARSNTKKSICTPTTRSAKPEAGLAGTSSSSITVGRTPAFNPKHRIRYTSTDRRNNWRHNALRKQAVEMPV